MTRLSCFLLAACALACGVSHPDDDVLGHLEQAAKSCPGGECPDPPEPPEPTTPPCNPRNPDCVVYPPCDQSTGSISLSKSAIKLGESITVSWSVNANPTCPGEIRLSSQLVAMSGSMTVKPLYDRPFRLTMGTRELAVAWVTVELPMTVYISNNTADERQLLIRAVGQPGRRVVLSHTLDLDMTGFVDIYVAPGVTLTSERPIEFQPITTAFVNGPITLPPGVPGRDPRNLGGRIFTNSRPRPLFVIACGAGGTSNVRFHSFRLQGPHWHTEEGDTNKEMGIVIDSCTDTEITNMELSGWSGSAIRVQDGQNVMTTLLRPKISGNFIHHNQHQGGFGYGVDVAAGAIAFIERNVFDFNRHAICASGAAGTGYRAEENLVLRGGGEHDAWYNETTHQFDVHGDGCWWSDDLCGNAGDTFWMFRNSFQYRKDYAINIRGTPRNFVEINDNVFDHGSLGDAIKRDGHADIGGSNRTGVDTYGKYGVCDFDGDGRDDLFLATGKTWWFSSMGKMQWTYLSNQSELLDEVGLADLNYDGRCDVFTVRGSVGAVSYSGTAQFMGLVQGLAQGTTIEEFRFADFNNDKKTDIFQRLPSGQWRVISPGVHGWRSLNTSGLPMSALRVGDFNGDGTADVLGHTGGTWSVSWGGITPWNSLNPSVTDSLENLLIGNVDGVPGDDVIRAVATSATTIRWDISSGGATPWQTLTTLTSEEPATSLPVVSARHFVGKFDEFPNSDLLVIEGNRLGRLFSHAHSNMLRYGMWHH